MVSSEVQRTLVKSPPELWAELSDPAALARHLGELGEIRIVKTKPEERVEWEADGVTGMVSIKASGWGTKVTLSVTHELGEPEPAAPGEAELPPAVEAEPPPAPETTPEPMAETERTPEDSATSDIAQTNEPESTPRRGFFARLFRRRAQPGEAPTPGAGAAPEPVPISEPEAPTTPAAEAIAPPEQEHEPPAIAISEPQSSTTVEQAEQTENLAVELKVAEEVDAEEVTAMLTAVLDRLGAAHHRPFSRS
jgi:hypothetical protein